MRSKFRKEVADSYCLLAEWLRKYHQQNPSACVVLQNDLSDSFYHLLVTIPNFCSILDNMCIKMLHVDGTFCKSGHYDGIIFIVSAMLSNNSVILLAICFLPSEFASHVAWMLLNLAKAGLDLSEYPVQTDRGNITDAVRCIYEQCNYVISLKYCLEHIIRNLTNRFNISEQMRPALRLHWSAEKGFGPLLDYHFRKAFGQ